MDGKPVEGAVSSEKDDQSSNVTNTFGGVTVEEIPSTQSFQYRTFAVQLPSEVLFEEMSLFDDIDNADSSTQQRHQKQRCNDMLWSHNNYGIVGTITSLGPKSVSIWFGWGQVLTTAPTADNNQQQGTENAATLHCSGRSMSRNMGPVVISMPQIQYRGAFASVADGASSSKLIGDGNTHNEMIAQQMSSRLSQRLGIAVLVSCTLIDGAPPLANEGMDIELINSRAAALTEKEIYRILKECR